MYCNFIISSITVNANNNTIKINATYANVASNIHFIQEVGKYSAT